MHHTGKSLILSEATGTDARIGRGDDLGCPSSDFGLSACSIHSALGSRRTAWKNRCVTSERRKDIPRLIDLDELRDALSEFTSCTEVPVGLLASDGQWVVRPQFCRACAEFHRADAKSEEFCLGSEARLLHELRAGRPRLAHECGNGFVQAGVSLVMEGTPVGFVVACGVLREPPDEDHARRIAERFGYDAPGYLEALQEAGCVSEARLTDAMAFLMRAVQPLVKLDDVPAFEGAGLARELEIRAALAELGCPLADPATSVSGLARAVLDKARCLTGSEHGYVSRIQPGAVANIRLAQTRMWGGDGSNVVRSSFPPGSSGSYPALWGYCLNTGEAFFTNEPATHPASIGVPPGHEPLRSFLSVPILRDNRLLGQVALANAPGGYSEYDLERVRQVANLLGLAYLRYEREEALVRSKERTELARRAAGIGIWEWQIAEGRVIWSPEIGPMWGFEAGQFGGRMDDVSGRIHPDDLKAWMESIRCCLEEGQEHSLEFRVVWPDGTVHWVSARGDVERDRSGRPVRMAGTVMDITSAKEAEVDRARLMMAIEQTGEEIIVTDRDGIILYVNPAFERVTGYTKAEAIGQTPRIIKGGRHEPEFYEEMWGTILRGETWSGQVVNKTKDGKLITEQLSISPVRDKSGEIVSFIGVKRDVSERVDLEEQLRRSQRMESVGLLAGGIAHDFNNMLLAILGFAEFLHEGLPAGSQQVQDVKEILKAARRGAELTRQLLAFSRRQVIKPVDQDLNELVHGLARMIRRVIGEHIRLEFLPGHALSTTRIDSGQIEQVVMNLCLNARDAMPNGGTLTIETGNVLIDGDYARTHPWARPGRFVLMTVTDTGHGMDAHTLDQMFEPFFTTKPIGAGTGLGLSTAYGIIKQHDGIISAYSEVGKGTMFKVYLPASERRAVDVGRRIEGPVRGGTETILVVEDDPLVRGLAERILRSAGYTVLLAVDGEDAVVKFNENAERVDLVLIDVVMPRMSGKEAMDKIMGRNPAIRYLYTSGYSENAVHTGFVLRDNVQLLRKPYARSALLREVRSILDER